jgi:hypothetical protein
MIRSPIPKHIGSPAIIGTRKKIGKEKQSKKEGKKTSGTQEKK